MHTEFLKWEEGRAREGENQEVRFRLWGECSLFHLSSHLGSCLWLGIYQPMMSILYSRPWICRHRVTLSYNNSLSTSEILRLLTGYHSDCLRKRKDSSPSWCNSSHQHCSTPWPDTGLWTQQRWMGVEQCWCDELHQLGDESFLFLRQSLWYPVKSLRISEVERELL